MGGIYRVGEGGIYRVGEGSYPTYHGGYGGYTPCIYTLLHPSGYTHHVHPLYVSMDYSPTVKRV